MKLDRPSPEDGDETVQLAKQVGLSVTEGESLFLTSVRQDMYNALSLFHDHVKHTLQLMFTLLTAVFAVLGIALSDKVPSANLIFSFKLVGGIILSLLFPLGIVSILIIGRYYKLYVAALFYAAEIHQRVELSSHSWFLEVLDAMESVPDHAQRKLLINKRTYGWPHSWILYTFLIGVISVAGLISGIIILYRI